MHNLAATKVAGGNPLLDTKGEEAVGDAMEGDSESKTDQQREEVDDQGMYICTCSVEAQPQHPHIKKLAAHYAVGCRTFCVRAID